jgi:hypothetical protein
MLINDDSLCYVRNPILKKYFIMSYRSQEISVAHGADLSASTLFVCDLVSSQNIISSLVIFFLPSFP